MSFAESINLQTDPKYVWDKCKIFKNSWTKITPQHCANNSDNVNKIEFALDKISPPWAPSDPIWLPPWQQISFFDSQFSLSEFHSALGP